MINSIQFLNISLILQRLDRKIRDNLRDARNNLFTSDGLRAGHVNFQRPVMIIVDRSMDLATMLHHTWTYQALVHDTLVSIVCCTSISVSNPITGSRHESCNNT
jgi:hypothetical protein